MSKHRVRKTIIIGLFMVIGIGALLRLTVEPADYYNSLNKQIDKAQSLLDKTVPGNAEGQYSEYTVELFRDRVDRAQHVAGERALRYSGIRSYLKEFKAAIAAYRKAGNEQCLSETEVADIKAKAGTFEKTVRVEKNRSLNWRLSGKSIDTPAPVNLEVKAGSAYPKVFEKFAAGMGVKGAAFTFLHNGPLPCNVIIELEFRTERKDLQIYRYDGKTGKLDNLIRAEAADNVAVFPINRGGTYFVLNAAVDDEGTAEKNVAQVLAKAVEEARRETETEKKQTPVISEAAEPGKQYCTVEIRCDTIVDKSKLTNKAVAGYVPKDGTILSETHVEILEGESAFEVLKRVTREEGVQMEFRMDPLYSGAYIEGINHLYEFDGGGGSGWMYKVNGWFPNYGCSQYKMKNGDKMVWCYTCNIGKDVGDQYYDTHPDANPEYQ